MKRFIANVLYFLALVGGVVGMVALVAILLNWLGPVFGRLAERPVTIEDLPVALLIICGSLVTIVFGYLLDDSP